MGKVNGQLSYYLNNPNRLADFFNAVVYGGQRVILPQQLADIQKCYQEPLSDRYGRKRTRSDRHRKAQRGQKGAANIQVRRRLYREYSIL